MDSQVRADIASARGHHLFAIYRIVFTVYPALAIFAALGLGQGGWIALAAVTLGTAIFGVLASDAALKDLDNLRHSMTEADLASAYGQGAQATPYPAFRAISAAINGIIALALLISF